MQEKYKAVNTKCRRPPRCTKYFLAVAIITTTFMLSACVYGPSTEKKSPLDILSEKNYQNEGWVLGVPVIKAKKRNTVIEGAVYINGLTPLKFEKLKIIDSNGSEILETTSTQNGSFKFQGYILNGRYMIKIDSKEYDGEKKINVEDYQLKNIIINAAPKSG